MKDLRKTKKELIVELDKLRSKVYEQEVAQYFSKDQVFQNFIESAPVGLLVVKSDGIIMFINEKTEKLFGYKREELIGKPIEVLLPKRIRKKHVDNRNKYFYEPSFVTMGCGKEIHGLHKNNRKIQVEIGLNTVETAEDMFAFCTVIDVANRRKAEKTLETAHDEIKNWAEDKSKELLKTNALLKNALTERKTVEKALRESEDKYRTIVHTANEGICIFNEKTSTTFVNDKIVEMLGYSADEIIDKSLFYFMSDESKRVALAHLNRRQDGIAEQHYIKFIRNDGGELWTVFTSRPLFEKNGKYIGAMATFTDITERKLAEAQIRKLSSAVEQSTSIIIITDTNARIDYVNPKFTQVTGYSSEEVLGKNPRILKSTETPLEVYNELWKTISSGGEWHGELHNKKKNGESYWARASISPIKNVDGITTHYLGVQEDITDRKKAQSALQNYATELERSNEELQQFAYVASHDLQEPLRMITSYLTLLENRYKDKLDDDADEFIDYAVNGAKRMKQLIKDLLQYSRVGTHGNPFKKTKCEEVLKKTLNNLEVTVIENAVDITHDKLPVVKADELQLLQLFQNLISNAIKFRSEKLPKIHIGAKSKNGEWIFSVQDNGIGIEKEYEKRIFIIFQRLHSNSKYPGTGIGLALCKKIVERHRGRIWFDSKPDEGSTFYFTIPRKNGGL
jgi:PAS domain S-box-containing protein